MSREIPLWILVGCGVFGVAVCSWEIAASSLNRRRIEREVEEVDRLWDDATTPGHENYGKYPSRTESQVRKEMEAEPNANSLFE